MISKKTIGTISIVILISTLVIFKLMFFIHNISQEKKYIDIKYLHLKPNQKTYSELNTPKGIINFSAIVVDNNASNVVVYKLKNIPQIKIEISSNMILNQPYFKKSYTSIFKTLEEKAVNKQNKEDIEVLIKDFESSLNTLFSTSNNIVDN